MGFHGDPTATQWGSIHIRNEPSEGSGAGEGGLPREYHCFREGRVLISLQCSCVKGEQSGASMLAKAVLPQEVAVELEGRLVVLDDENQLRTRGRSVRVWTLSAPAISVAVKSVKEAPLAALLIVAERHLSHDRSISTPGDNWL